jgi:hypothetical protein
MHGDSTIVPEEFDGINKGHALIGSNQSDYYATFTQYIASGRCVDKRGSHVTPEDLQEGCQLIKANFGVADTLVCGLQTLGDFSSQEKDKSRFVQVGAGFGTELGMEVLVIRTPFGKIKILGDIFIQKDPRKTTDPVGLDPNGTAIPAPVADASAPAALTGAADAQSLFTVTENTQIVYYAVATLNRFGKSALTVLGSAVTLTTGRSVDLRWAAAATATGYEVYRSLPVAPGTPAAGLSMFPIFKVSASELANGYDGAAAGLVRDRNRFLPNTQEAMLLSLDSETINLCELMPVSLYDLAMLTPSFRKMVLYFVAPKLAQATKVVRYINIGKFNG